ncbi:37S ribosomal protein S9, mitochondrial [Dinochytrium kinnereticum]|nr:37S ribosomal protein S9, mitochondrial [Dinochytrium kinnereticum]
MPCQRRWNSDASRSRIFNENVGYLPQRPKDIAYFTGNPKYFRFLMKVNDFIRKHGLPFQDKAVYQEIKSLPKWLSSDEMRESKQFKITDRMYNDFIHKLNILFTVQEKDPEVADLLNDFVRPGEALIATKAENVDLDEFGRSFTRGSRKTAVAQCWMVEGDGQVFVNGVKLADYFPQLSDCQKVILPFEATQTLGSYNVWAIVKGGGLSVGLTKIDRRQVERKKTGQPKARKKNSWISILACHYFFAFWNGMSIECSLNGLVTEKNVPKLLERIVGLCGFISFDGSTNLFEHEIVFAPDVVASYGQTDVFLRLRGSVYRQKTFVKLHDRQWLLFVPELVKPSNRM